MLKGSSARHQWVGVPGGYQGLFQQLVADGVLVADGSAHLLFSDDYAFSSPSAAAAVVCGRSANGRISWMVEGSDVTYAAWQDQQLNGTAVTPESETIDA
ncbi:hypothetical protein D3C78_1624280 [compost metagenome]